MYHVAVHELAERVLRPYPARGIAAAPGIGLALRFPAGLIRLRCCGCCLNCVTNLALFVSVVHFNHKLRGAESEADQEFVADLAREHGLEFYAESGDVARVGGGEHSGVEAAARELRYGFFRRLLGSGSTEDSVPQGLKPSISSLSVGSAESAAPPKSIPQGLKPASFDKLRGPAEVVPFPIQVRR